MKTRLEETSHRTLTHVDCLKNQKCQETEGLKGTEHEGVDVCEDGCVWYVPKRKQNLTNMKKRTIEVWYISLGLSSVTFLLPVTAVWYILTGKLLPEYFFNKADEVLSVDN